MKLPRDLSGQRVVQALKRLGFSTSTGDRHRDAAKSFSWRSPPLAAINPVVSYIDAPYDIAFDIERGAEIVGNFHSMNRFTVDSRELVNFVRSQARIEGILLENLERSCRQSLLLRSQSR